MWWEAAGFLRRAVVQPGWVAAQGWGMMMVTGEAASVWRASRKREMAGESAGLRRGRNRALPREVAAMRTWRGSAVAGAVMWMESSHQTGRFPPLRGGFMRL